jgi:transcriptional regulator with XRE-family HTH domain
MPLKDRIAEAIAGSGKSKAEISRACDVTNAAITHWLNGNTANLKADKALALEVATGYRDQWILSARGPKKADEPYWPFSLPIKRFTDLNEKQQGYVEARLEIAIQEAEALIAAKQVIRGLGVKGDTVGNEKVEQHYPLPPHLISKPVAKKSVVKKKSA